MTFNTIKGLQNCNIAITKNNSKKKAIEEAIAVWEAGAHTREARQKAREMEAAWRKRRQDAPSYRGATVGQVARINKELMELWG